MLLTNLHVVDNVEMDKQYRALVNLARAREFLSREDALLGSSLVVGKLTRDETRDISDLVAQRTLMYDVNLPLLPASERGHFERFWKNAASAPLRVAERAAASSESGSLHNVTAQTWNTAAGAVLDKLGTLDDQANDRYQDRVRPVAMNVILKAAVAGVLGLIALLFSLFLSVRIGRGLIRDLRQLRLDAHEASGVRLPSVMRRLSVGEVVDVETEVPRLEYDRNEIGDVGQALNTLQRAAVEAAVKQAELRSGVSEVFVNLARRSQVLLHKQLTLLDTMERRTEDTDELADLFRLDHLTTRHASARRGPGDPLRGRPVPAVAQAGPAHGHRPRGRGRGRGLRTHRGPQAAAHRRHRARRRGPHPPGGRTPGERHGVLPAAHRRPGRGERVANGFTLEIHDRGLGMAAEALLDANLRLAETPEFELSDTDRLGLFVVSRLAQRQNVRVSLQPSPYGGTTAVVFIPDALLSDDVPDTNGIGFRLDRPRPTKEAELEESHRSALSQMPVKLPGLPPALLDGPVELEAPVDLDALEGFPNALDDEDGERGGIFRPRRASTHRDDLAPVRPVEQHQQVPEADTDGRRGEPLPLPRRRTPKLVSSHGRPVVEQRSRHEMGTPERPISTAPPRPRPWADRRRTAPHRSRPGDAVTRRYGAVPTSPEDVPKPRSHPPPRGAVLASRPRHPRCPGAPGVPRSRRALRTPRFRGAGPDPTRERCPGVYVRPIWPRS